MEENRKARLTIQVIEIRETDVGLWIFAVGENAPILKLADQGLDDGVVGTHNGEAVKWDILDKPTKCILHGLKSLEVVEMLGVYVCYNGDIGRQLEECAVRFIRLHNHPIAGAEPRIGAVRVDNPSIYYRWIKTASIEQRRDERRRGRLSVCARDCDAAFQPHQFSQHLGTSHHRKPLGARGNEFRVVTLDR